MNAQQSFGLDWPDVQDAIPDDPQLIDDDAIELPPLAESLDPVDPLPLESGGTLTLRDYQVDAVTRIYGALRESRSTLAVLATGLGKTVIAAEVAALWPETNGRVLFLAHRKELIEQGAKSIGLHIDEDCGIEMAGTSEARSGRPLAGHSKVLVASVQTLSRLNRLKPYKPGDFGLIITDEAHHGTAKTYKTIFGYFQQNPQCRFLGITATPDRADDSLLGEVFDSVAYKMDICEGIDAGWLVPIRQRYVTIEGLDFAGCRTTAGDLNERDLERAMSGANTDELGEDDSPLTEDQISARRKQEAMLHAVADPTIREAAGRPGIVFCVTVDHADKMAAIFRRYGVTAESVTPRTSPDERTEHVAAFKSGRLQFLIGVGVFTEGFDAPNAAVISVARPTKSRSLYTQMVGRATRPEPSAINGIISPDERKAAIAASGKPAATVLDFVGNSGRHKLISTADILGGKFPEDLRAYVVAQMQRLGGTVDMAKEIADHQARREAMQVIARNEAEAKRLAAQKRHDELMARLREEERLKEIRAKARYKSRSVDPFGNRSASQSAPREFEGGASEKQIRFAESLGVPHDTALRSSRRQLAAIITSLRARRGGAFRIWFGKHRGKSLADAGEGWAQFIESNFEEGPLRKELMDNIRLWRLEKAGAIPRDTGDASGDF